LHSFQEALNALTAKTTVLSISKEDSRVGLRGEKGLFARGKKEECVFQKGDIIGPYSGYLCFASESVDFGILGRLEYEQYSFELSSLLEGQTITCSAVGNL